MNRRKFVQLTGGAFVSTAFRPAVAESSANRHVPGSSPIRLGLVVWIQEGQPVDDAIRRVHDLGLQTCQIGFEHLTANVAQPVKNALKKYGIEATAFSEHGPGNRVFDFYQGPETIGIVPPGLRRARIHNLKMAADIATECDIPSIHTHVGFIPENPNNPLYAQSVAAMKDIVGYCGQHGRSFLCETGTETPTALLRMIQDVGMDNLFVNLDVANLIVYDKGNPVDAMDVIGHLVRGIHAKDGLFPTGTRELGRTVALGRGKVNFPVVMEKLKQVNYQGPMTLEPEGEEEERSVPEAKVFLERLLAKAYS